MEGREATMNGQEPAGTSAVSDSLAVPFLAAGAAAIVAILLLHGTFQSMISIWLSSETYAHGFFILPISLYLIWDERSKLAGARAKANYWVIPLLGAAGFGWLVCRIVGVNVLEQYAAVAIVGMAVWCVVGNDLARRMAFPLGFLLLSVPIGDSLLPMLIDQTADVTDAALRLSGIPVLRDGRSLTLPTGTWAVVEACSGLRYLIASVTLGLLYAHMSYRSWWRRGVCMIASIIIPILANWFRAYLIVMVGHLSNMRLAVGIDHLVYGWLLFGVVVLVFFWVGSFFREDMTPEPTPEPSSPVTSPAPGRLFLAVAVVFLAVSIWPLWAARAESVAAVVPADVAFPFPDRTGSFEHEPVEPEWLPEYEGQDLAFERLYRRGEDRVGLHAACYLSQRQGAEVVSAHNRYVAYHQKEYRVIHHGRHDLVLPDRELNVTEVRIGPYGPFVVWRWYWLEGRSTASQAEAKLLELSAKLAGRPSAACGVTAFVVGNDDSARAVLTEFLGEAFDDVESGLARVTEAE